jgi:DDE family transposase
MFVRVKTLHANRRTYQYLHIVENRWENGKVRQRIVGSLGRLDQLLASGDLRQLIEGLVAHCPQVRLLEAQRHDALAVESDRVWGPVLIFERLWQELGLEELCRELARGGRLGFAVERCAWAMVLQRLLEPGSDRRGAQWIHTLEARGFEGLRLPHFYRTAGWLWRRKERIERHLYARDRDLFNEGLDLVFFDTTSTYFEGRRWKGWAKLGKSRDHRGDHLQLILGVVMRRDGVPITCEIWPGNLHDTKTLVPILEGLKKRFRIAKVVLVCDRGMVSAKNLKAIRQAGYDYIVGMKMRGLLEVREEVLKRAGRYREVKHNLWVKEVWVGERRYVVCVNPERAEKDRQDRQAILQKLEAKLASGGVKHLISNRGYRRFLKVMKGAAQIDAARVKADERYDGKYVLRTTTELPAWEVAEAYKQLTWIERLWRELKHVMEVRPIYHHRKKENVKGHIFGSFLALYLSAMLRRRLEELRQKEHPEEVAPSGGLAPARLPIPWDKLLEDLSQVRAITVRLDNQRYLMRTELQGHASEVFRAIGVRPPPLAQPLDG